MTCPSYLLLYQSNPGTCVSIVALIFNFEAHRQNCRDPASRCKGHRKGCGNQWDTSTDMDKTRKQNPQHKNKTHNTKIKLTTQKQNPQHKNKTHNTKTKLATPKQNSQHKNKTHNTKTKLTTQKQNSQHKSKTHNTKTKLTTQKQNSQHKNKTCNTKTKLTTRKQISQHKRVPTSFKHSHLVPNCRRAWLHYMTCMFGASCEVYSSCFI